MNLRTLRELKGISRRELAEAAGISFRSIQDYEQGHKDLSSAKADTLQKLARTLDCTMEDLISDVDLSELKPSSIRSGDSKQTEKSHVRSALGIGDPYIFRLNPADEQPYFLMHKDDAVAGLVMEPVSGAIISVNQVIDRRLLPPGAEDADLGLKRWWNRRAVPITQSGISEILERTGFVTPQAYLVRNLGLSMEDCYWLKPVNADSSWNDVSLFRNDFEDVIGSAEFSGLDAMIDFRNFDVRFPSASTHGNVPKSWICMENGRRCLVKGPEKGNTQQIFNEVVAAYIHRKQGKFPFVDYQFYTIDYGSGQMLCVSSDAFTSERLEFIPAADLISSRNNRARDDYENFIDACIAGGLKRDYVIRFLDYQILTDFVISNTDRSFENFGVLRNADTLRFESMAPIFDSGNSMFFDLDMTRGTLDLKNIPVHSFAANEACLLRLVKDPDMVDLNRLLSDDELSQVLQSSSRTPEEIRVLVQIYDRKKDLLFKLKKGDTAWMN